MGRSARQARRAIADRSAESECRLRPIIARKIATSRSIAAAALAALAGIGLFLLKGSSSDGTLVFDWPADNRADTTISIDGTPQTIPASGPWEYRYPAGSHRIVAEHLAYKLDTNVDLVAGSQQSVPADWKPKAVLVLNWPLELRSGAELKIDGRTQAISQHEPIEVAIEPGRHTIQITGRGFDPINTTATVAADGRESVSIVATPTTAKLVFDWPADERKNAELILDGRSQAIAAGADSAPIELTLCQGDTSFASRERASNRSTRPSSCRLEPIARSSRRGRRKRKQPRRSPTPRFPRKWRRSRRKNCRFPPPPSKRRSPNN